MVRTFLLGVSSVCKSTGWQQMFIFSGSDLITAPSGLLTGLRGEGGMNAH